MRPERTFQRNAAKWRWMVVLLCGFSLVWLVGSYRNSAASQTTLCAAFRFQPNANSFVGELAAETVRLADLNRDNKPEVIQLTQNRLTVKWGESFATEFSLSIPASRYLTIGDFNADGNTDLILIGQQLTLLRGNGQGSFAAVPQQALNWQFVDVVAGEFTGDAALDIALFNQPEGRIEILSNQGDGTFRPAVNLMAVSGAHSLVVADCNQDGKADLLARNFQARSLGVYLQRVGGQFDRLPEVNVGGFPESVQAQDLNADGRIDLVVGLRTSATSIANATGGLVVFEGLGDGRFVERQRFEFPFVVYELALADFNGDQRLDVVAAHRFVANQPSALANLLLAGLGDGRFAAPLRLPEMQERTLLGVADLNADGKSDLLMSSSATQSPVLLNVTNCNGASNTPPRIAPLTQALTLRATEPARSIVLADLSDSETAATDLLIEPESVPLGLVVRLTNAAGKATVAVAASCIAVGEQRLRYRVTDSAGASVTQEVVFQVVANTPSLTDLPDLTKTWGSAFSVEIAGTADSFRVNSSNGFTGTIANFRTFNGRGVVFDAIGPVGKHVITVAADNGCGQVVTKQFTLTVSNASGLSGCPLVRFESSWPTTHRFGVPFNDSGWRSAAMADLDGDGNQDWIGVAANGQFRWMNGNRQGGVSTARAQPLDQGFPDGVTRNTVWVMSGDFTGNGLADVFTATTTTTAGNLHLWQNRNGAFSLQQTFSVSLDGIGSSGFYQLHELNGDGKPDVVYAAGNRFVVLLTNERNELDAPRSLALVDNPSTYAVGDFNQDGKADLLAGNATSLFLLAGQGGDQFEAARAVANSQGEKLLGSADFDNDRADDLIVYDTARSQLGIRLNRNQSFNARVNLDVRALHSPSFGLLLPHSVTADFNRDGKLDLAVSNPVLSSATVLLGDGQGGFGRAMSYGLNFPPLRLFVQDVNQDGKLDLVAPLYSNNTLVILLGDGAGAFAAQRASPMLTQAISASSLGDFNGDGKQDAALLQPSNPANSNTVTLYAGTAQSVFEQAARVEVAAGFTSSLSEDFDRDGKTDLFIFSANHEGRFFRSNFARDWSGALASPGAFQLSGPPILSADFNGDGLPDWLTGEAGNVARVAFNQIGNQGAPLFAMATSMYVLPTGVTEIKAGDLNGDGLADLVVMHSGGVLILRGSSSGGFSRMSQLSVTGEYLHLADFNNDGKRDLIFFKRDTLQTVFCQGDGEGRFGMVALHELGTDPNVFVFVATHVADFNADGNLDLLGLAAEPILALGDGKGGFQAPSFLNFYAQQPLAVADVNGDGLPDIINLQSSNFGASIEVLRNLYRCAPPRAAVSVSAATFDSSQPHAPEMIAAVFGESLATTTAVASSPLPTTLGGTTVSVRDSAGVERPAPLFAVSPTQVNYLVPAETALGTATVTVNSGQGTVSRGNINVSTIAPGIFSAESNGKGFPAGLALRINGEGVSTYAPVVRFDSVQQRFVAVPINLLSPNEAVFLVLYGTGWRRRSSLTNVIATVGGVAVPVLYAGAQQSLIGLDQFNLQLPVTLAGRGTIDVKLIVDGHVTNTMQVVIQ